MKKLTKKEIKAIKKDIYNLGLYEVVFDYNLTTVITLDDISNAIEKSEQDFNYLNKYKNLDLQVKLMELVIEHMKYQEFKKCIPFLIGYSEYTFDFKNKIVFKK